MKDFDLTNFAEPTYTISENDISNRAANRMAQFKFKYKAISETGKTVKGSIQADNETVVEGKLKEMGLELLEVNRVNDSPLLALLSKGSMDYKEKMMIFVYLEQLTRAGVPLLDTLRDTAESCENYTSREVMNNLYERVQDGALLSEAMKEQKKHFDDVEIALIAISEKTGALASAFHDITDNLKWSAEISSKTIKALAYPIFSLIVIIGVICAMMILVVPKITTFLLDMGNELSGSTKALIATSEFVSKYALLIIGGIFAFFMSIKFLLKISKTFALWFDTFKVKVPIFGPVFQKLDLSRFCRFFAVTFDSGMPALECLDVAGLIVKNLYIKEVIKEIRQKVSDGASINEAINSSGSFPNLVKTMFKVGEESGNIKEALANINYFYDREINEAIEKMMAGIKPLMMFVVGGLLAWVIVSVFGPLYGMIGNLSGVI